MSVVATAKAPGYFDPLPTPTPIVESSLMPNYLYAPTNPSASQYLDTKSAPTTSDYFDAPTNASASQYLDTKGAPTTSQYMDTSNKIFYLDTMSVKNSSISAYDDVDFKATAAYLDVHADEDDNPVVYQAGNPAGAYTDIQAKPLPVYSVPVKKGPGVQKPILRKTSTLEFGFGDVGDDSPHAISSKETSSTPVNASAYVDMTNSSANTYEDMSSAATVHTLFKKKTTSVEYKTADPQNLVPGSVYNKILPRNEELRDTRGSSMAKRYSKLDRSADKPKEEDSLYAFIGMGDNGAAQGRAQAHALYSFVAAAPGELSLEEGEFLTDVKESENPGWSFGTRIRDGVKGYFPSSFAAACEIKP